MASAGAHKCQDVSIYAISLVQIKVECKFQSDCIRKNIRCAIESESNIENDKMLECSESFVSKTVGNC